MTEKAVGFEVKKVSPETSVLKNANPLSQNNIHKIKTQAALRALTRRVEVIEKKILLNPAAGQPAAQPPGGAPAAALKKTGVNLFRFNESVIKNRIIDHLKSNDFELKAFENIYMGGKVIENPQNAVNIAENLAKNLGLAKRKNYTDAILKTLQSEKIYKNVLRHKTRKFYNLDETSNAMKMEKLEGEIELLTKQTKNNKGQNKEGQNKFLVLKRNILIELQKEKQREENNKGRVTYNKNGIINSVELAKRFIEDHQKRTVRSNNKNPKSKLLSRNNNKFVNIRVGTETQKVYKISQFALEKLENYLKKLPFYIKRRTEEQEKLLYNVASKLVMALDGYTNKLKVKTMGERFTGAATWAGKKLSKGLFGKKTQNAPPGAPAAEEAAAIKIQAVQRGRRNRAITAKERIQKSSAAGAPEGVGPGSVKVAVV
tara:strand:- start:477 stop:1766 length:1290 start_codon:yes stop_codon:yes gene_type:complete